MLAEGTVISGQYQVLSKLDEGGMSYIYNARHLLTGQRLVIKEAIREKAQNDRTLVQNLVMEGNLLKKLSNSHLPKIYEILEYADQILIIMDYVEGENLYKVLKSKGAFPMEQVIEIAIQICDVFHYLHTQQPPIIYRDMKPSNVILQENGNIMLIDFGTARTWKGDMGLTSDTVLFGTEGFAAPEQFGGMGESDSRTDIYCIGSTLFNLVTNHDPYTKPFGIIPLGEINTVWKDCALDKIIRKCTERDPDMRYQSVLELKEALLEAASNPLSKGNLLSKLNTNKTKSGKLNSQGWAAPSMSVSSGFSQELIRRSQMNSSNAGGKGSPVLQHFDPGTEVLKMAGPKASAFQQIEKEESVKTSQTSVSLNINADLVKLIMMIALVIGIGLGAITIVLLLQMSSTAIVTGILGLGSFLIGFVFAVLYLKG